MVNKGQSAFFTVLFACAELTCSTWAFTHDFDGSFHRLTSTRLFQFDISKPVFDLYSLRQVRGDALTKYNSLNQSEPLRINLSLLLAFALFSGPTIAPEVTAESLTLPQTALAVIGGLGASTNFARECHRRNRQLIRLEKELSALQLPMQLPQNALADSAFQKPESVVSVCRQGKRILVLSGSSKELQASLQELKVFGRRLEQASVVVVPVPTDNGKSGDPQIGRVAWLGQPGGTTEWLSYFKILDQEERKSKWFGLSSSGRSFASGTDISKVSWIQLLGQHLRPTVLLDEDDPNAKDELGVLNQLEKFYDSLIEGKLADMNAVCLDQEARDVSKVIEEGGRLDDWTNCLQDGNRPEGMKIADADVTIVSETLAYSTCVEFPAIIDAQLLAVQTWERSDVGSEWKMALHQTIPWTDNAAAAGTLLCDKRGCVSLTRSPERRTFGGLIR